MPERIRVMYIKPSGDKNDLRLYLRYRKKNASNTYT
jgi:hypothetical protein